MATVINVREDYSGGVIVKTTRLFDDGTTTVNGGPSIPATAETLDRVALLKADGNRTTLEQKADAALATNDTFLATVAGRRTAIANALITATAMSTATVTTTAQAQAQIRSVGSLLMQVANAMTAMNDQAEALSKQSNAVIRLALNRLDSSAGT